MPYVAVRVVGCICHNCPVLMLVFVSVVLVFVPKQHLRHHRHNNFRFTNITRKHLRLLNNISFIGNQKILFQKIMIYEIKKGILNMFSFTNTLCTVNILNTLSDLTLLSVTAKTRIINNIRFKNEHPLLTLCEIGYRCFSFIPSSSKHPLRIETAILNRS